MEEEDEEEDGDVELETADEDAAAVEEDDDEELTAEDDAFAEEEDEEDEDAPVLEDDEELVALLGMVTLARKRKGKNALAVPTTVTEPVCAKARPENVVVVPKEMDEPARMVPITVAPSANVPAFPRAQYTLSGRPPFDIAMVVPVEVINVVGATNTHMPVVFDDPYPARVRLPELKVNELVLAPDGL